MDMDDHAIGMYSLIKKFVKKTHLQNKFLLLNRGLSPEPVFAYHYCNGIPENLLTLYLFESYYPIVRFSFNDKWW
jgi:hypothetical protein